MKENWNNISDYWKDILIAHVRLNYFNGRNSWFGDPQDGDIDIFEEYQMEFKNSFIRNETVEEIEKIRNLKHLRIQMLGLSDLSVLKYLDLESIQAYSNNLSDISVFSHLPNLHTIDISNNCISDIMPLKFCHKIEAIELFKQGKFKEARTLICKQIQPEEYDEVYRFMYQNLDLWAENSDQEDEAIIIIRDALCKHAVIADPEINLSATFILLGNIGK